MISDKLCAAISHTVRHYAGSLASIRCGIVLSLWSKDFFLIWEPLETI